MRTSSLGDFIRERRESLGISQAQVAADVYRNPRCQPRISRIESEGICDIQLLIRLGKLLGFSLSDVEKYFQEKEGQYE